MQKRMMFESFRVRLESLKISQNLILKVAQTSWSAFYNTRVLPRACRTVGTLLVLATSLIEQNAQAQAPSLAWVTNLGAQVFGVDAQTNLYATAGAKFSL